MRDAASSVVAFDPPPSRSRGGMSGAGVMLSVRRDQLRPVRRFAHVRLPSLACSIVRPGSDLHWLSQAGIRFRFPLPHFRDHRQPDLLSWHSPEWAIRNRVVSLAVSMARQPISERHPIA